jgi:hypothetical protein
MLHFKQIARATFHNGLEMNNKRIVRFVGLNESGKEYRTLLIKYTAENDSYSFSIYSSTLKELGNVVLSRKRLLGPIACMENLRNLGRQ